MGRIVLIGVAAAAGGILGDYAAERLAPGTPDWLRSATRYGLVAMAGVAAAGLLR